MAKGVINGIFSLIQSLNKNEKRYIKLMLSLHGDSEEKKIILLFDEINNQTQYDEKKILQKIPSIKPSQIPNMKAYLTEKILQSLRAYNISRLPDIQIREQIDFAQLLFERRLFNQGINCLKKAKKMAEENENLELLLEIIKLEKNIILEVIDDENIHKVDSTINEVSKINSQINHINIFSNLSLKFDYFFARIGSVRNENDYNRTQEFFNSNIPAVKEADLSITERLYLYNLYVAYYSFIRDHENEYLYAKKLISLFDAEEKLISKKTETYLKSLNSMLIALYSLNRFSIFSKTLDKLNALASLPALQFNENLSIRYKKYCYMHEINRYYMTGDFSKGVAYIENPASCAIEDLLSKLDKHTALIFYYKISCLYFGAANFSMAVKWMNRIINEPNVEIREDLHCFARIINLICHYELENFDVINYYIVSTYRFLLKKDDLQLYQKYILTFLKSLNKALSKKELTQMFSALKAQLIPLTEMAFSKKSFLLF